MKFSDEENKLILMARHEMLVSDFGAHVEMAMEPMVASVLSRLAPDEIRLAASTAVPLFLLDIEVAQLENLILAAEKVNWKEGCSYDGEKYSPTQQAIAKENEYLIVNRWAAARESSIATRITYALSESMQDFLCECTLHQIKQAARMGYVFGKLSVPPHYFHQAGVSVHLTSSQRDALAIASSIKTKR